MASLVSGLIGGFLGSNAAQAASQAEVSGAEQAQQVSQQNQQAANSFQQGVWQGTQANENPYLSLGSTSANSLRNLLGQGFQAPTLEQAENTPGYQFNLQQGTQAIDENAAANGTLLSGNTGVALQKYGQGLAQNTYQQAYQNALNSYMANYQTLMGGTEAGQTATGQEGQLGQAAAVNTGNIDLTAAQQQMQQINNAAAARASGYLGSANAWGNALGGIAGGAGEFGSSIAQGLSGGGGFGDVMSSLAGMF
jgi:hypothetical protein